MDNKWTYKGINGEDVPIRFSLDKDQPLIEIDPKWARQAHIPTRLPTATDKKQQDNTALLKSVFAPSAGWKLPPAPGWSMETRGKPLEPPQLKAPVAPLRLAPPSSYLTGTPPAAPPISSSAAGQAPLLGGRAQPLNLLHTAGYTGNMIGQGVQNAGRGFSNAVKGEVAASLDVENTFSQLEKLGIPRPQPVNAEGAQQNQAMLAQNKAALEKSILNSAQQSRMERAAIEATYPTLPQYAKTAGQLVGTVGQVAPVMAASAISPLTGMQMLYGMASGNEMAEALQAGADIHSAKKAGIASGISEITIEKLFGGIPMLGNGAISPDDLVRRYINSPSGQAIAKAAFNALGEGAEEVASEVLAPFIKRAYYDPNAPMPTMDELAMAFGGGAVAAAILGGANEIVQYNAPLAKAERADSIKLQRIEMGYNRLSKGVLGAEGTRSMPQIPLGPNATPEMIARAAENTATTAAPNGIDSTLKTEYNADRGDFYGTSTAKVTGVDARGSTVYRAETGLGDNATVGSRGLQAPLEYGRNVGRNSGRPSISVVSSDTRATLDTVGSAQLNIRDTTSTPADFSDALDKARASQRFGGLVDGHAADDLSSKGIRSFLSDDGMAGGAVEPNGNITAVFKDKSKAGYRVPDEVMLTAITSGGDRLDCYAGDVTNESLNEIQRLGYLPGLYEKYGFYPVARVPFNPEYAEADFVAKYDVPRDVIVFAHNGDSAEIVAKKLGDYKHYSVDEYMKLPVFSDYDQALAYRDSVMERKGGKGKQGGFGQNTVGAAESGPSTIGTGAGQKPLQPPKLGMQRNNMQRIEPPTLLQNPNAPNNQNLYAVNQDLSNVAGVAKGVARDAYQYIVSGQSPLERMQKANTPSNPSIDAATQLARQSGGTVDNIAEGALVSPNAEKLDISYVKLMESIPKGQLDLFNDYAQNLHNISRMSLEDRAIQKVNQFELAHPEMAGMPRANIEATANAGGASSVFAKEYLKLIGKAENTKNKPVFGEVITRINNQGRQVSELGGRTAEQSQKIVAEYEASNPSFRKTIDRIESWWDKFGKAWMVDTGLMSEESYAAMREMYPYYVPTFREEKQGGFGSGMSGRNISTPSTIKAATGGTGKIIPLEESFMAQINRTVKAARRNELGQAVLAFAEADPEIAAINGVRLSKDSGGDFKTSDVETFLDSVDAETLKQLNNGGYRLTTLVDGERVNMDISEDVYNGLKWLQDAGISDAGIKWFMRGGKAITGPAKAAITGINALFAVTNTVRDIQTYHVNSISNNPLQLTSNYAKAIFDIVTNSETAQQYRALGGSRSGFYGQQAGFKNSLPRKLKDMNVLQKAGKVVTTPITAPFKAAARVGEFTEQVPRLAEFRNAVQKYGNTPEGLKKAAYAAADVTVNFSRGAPVTKVLDAWTLYLNAQVQGLDKTVRQTKSKPIATLSKAAITLTLPTLLLALINRDNPYYDELDDRTKDTYFLVPNINDTDESGNAETFLKIPKSREWGAVMSSSFDRMAKYYEAGDIAEAFSGYGKTLATSFLPTNPASSNVFSPLLVDLKSNKDFAGRPIVPQAMQKLPKQYQYDVNTSNVARVVGARFNLSPKQVDYLIDSYAGYPGDIIQALSSPKNIGRTPLETAQNALQNAVIEPFSRRFMANPLYSNYGMNKFYDAIAKATEEAAGKNFSENIPSNVVTPEDKRVSYLTKEAAKISELRAIEKDILETPMPKLEKGREIDAVRQKMNEIAKNALSTADEVVGNYAKAYDPDISMLSEQMQAKWRSMKALVPAKLFHEAYEAQKNLKSQGALSASERKKIAVDTATPGISRAIRQRLYTAFDISEKAW